MSALTFDHQMKWNDMLLQWNPDEFGGVTEIRVPTVYIWTPDVVLYNYADIRLKEHRDALAVISSNGDVLWIPMAILKSTCHIDILYFPYDEQTCYMKFGSWTYDGFMLDVDFFDGLKAVDVSDYTVSNEWKLISSPAVKNVKYYPCCEQPYPDLTFTIHVRRVAILYSFTITLPCVLLSFLTVVTFWLPPENSAKMLLGMSIFVAFFLLLRILSDSTPPASSTVPLIGAYFCLNMVLITLSCFLSVIVINLYNRADKKARVPDWVRMVALDGLARLFCMPYEQLEQSRQRRRQQKREQNMISMTETNSHGTRRKKDKERKKIRSPLMTYNKWERTASDGADSPIATKALAVSTTDPAGKQIQAFTVDVRELRRSLRSFMNRLLEKDATNRVNLEWRVVALAIDRMFFYIFLSVIIVSLITVFPWTRTMYATS
ncbi:Acetylcholine receptor subunit alpha-like 1 [Lamellibrachia satsuma]|nr:Acetylcholine receptor subunit alpha-like 1 [Lamellibrachia satsuma]